MKKSPFLYAAAVVAGFIGSPPRSSAQAVPDGPYRAAPFSPDTIAAVKIVGELTQSSLQTCDPQFSEYNQPVGDTTAHAYLEQNVRVIISEAVSRIAKAKDRTPLDVVKEMQQKKLVVCPGYDFDDTGNRNIYGVAESLPTGEFVVTLAYPDTLSAATESITLGRLFVTAGSQNLQRRNSLIDYAEIGPSLFILDLKNGFALQKTLDLCARRITVACKSSPNPAGPGSRIDAIEDKRGTALDDLTQSGFKTPINLKL